MARYQPSSYILIVPPIKKCHEPPLQNVILNNTRRTRVFWKIHYCNVIAKDSALIIIIQYDFESCADILI
jgi:hypothetical protein